MIKATERPTTIPPPHAPDAPQASRRALLMGLAVAATPMAPALANALSEPAPAAADPVFAMIEHHRAAVAEYNKAEAIGGIVVGPAWEAAWAVTSAAMDRKDDLLEELLRTQPKTLSGAIALLEHLVQDEFLGVDWEGTEDDRETLLSTFNGSSCIERKRLAQDFPGHFAAALRAYVERLNADRSAKPPTTEPIEWTPELEERSQALAKVIAAKLRGEL
jgi:hypothetical protein